MAAHAGWMHAVTAASFNNGGGTDAGPANKSFFYSALRHRQNSPFGPFGLGQVDWATFDAADYPWALPEPLFRQLYPDVMAGRGRTYERPPKWSDVQAIGTAIGLSGPASGMMKKSFKAFLLRYAPAFAESATAEWATPAVLAAGGAGIQVANWAARMHNRETRQTFQLDARRRDYDRTITGAVASR